jgi:hypothetical protein
LLVGRFVVLHVENFEERVEDMKEQWVLIAAFSGLAKSSRMSERRLAEHAKYHLVEASGHCHRGFYSILLPGQIITPGTTMLDRLASEKAVQGPRICSVSRLPIADI